MDPSHKLDHEKKEQLPIERTGESPCNHMLLNNTAKPRRLIQDSEHHRLKDQPSETTTKPQPVLFDKTDLKNPLIQDSSAKILLNLMYLQPNDGSSHNTEKTNRHVQSAVQHNFQAKIVIFSAIDQPFSVISRYRPHYVLTILHR